LPEIHFVPRGDNNPLGVKRVFDVVLFTLTPKCPSLSKYVLTMKKEYGLIVILNESNP